jgi:hypothetical protein
METQQEPRLKTLSNGAVYDLDKGRIVTGPPGGGTQAITSDNAKEMLARRRLVGLRAQLRGLARAEGVDPSEIDDELLMQAGSAVEALTLHMAKTFKESKSLRGMSEAYGALTSPLVGDRRQKDEEPQNEPTSIHVLIAQFINMSNQPPADVIDGTTSE